MGTAGRRGLPVGSTCSCWLWVLCSICVSCVAFTQPSCTGTAAPCCCCCREVRIVNQLYNGVFREKGWATTSDFKPLLSVATNPRTTLTAFFPSDESWRRVADHYCLTQQAVLDNISNLPSMLAGYIKSHLMPGITLFSTDFEDGMQLQSMRERDGAPVNHTLSKTEV